MSRRSRRLMKKYLAKHCDTFDTISKEKCKKCKTMNNNNVNDFKSNEYLNPNVEHYKVEYTTVNMFVAFIVISMMAILTITPKDHIETFISNFISYQTNNFSPN